MELNCNYYGVHNLSGTQCGMPLRVERPGCAQCGTLNSPDSKLCGHCGTSLVRASEEKKECRRPTVLFCDLVGSTTLSQQMDLEDYWKFLEVYWDACCKVIKEFHGYPAQFYGDRTLAYFGYPKAHEDDARQAIAAGLHIVKAVGGLETSGHPIHVRVGIHTGEVLIGQLGVGRNQDHLALGKTPNLADRVQKEAQPNTVLITEHPRRLVAGFLEIEEQKPLSRKQSICLENKKQSGLSSEQ